VAETRGQRRVGHRQQAIHRGRVRRRGERLPVGVGGTRVRAEVVAERDVLLVGHRQVPDRRHRRRPCLGASGVRRGDTARRTYEHGTCRQKRALPRHQPLLSGCLLET
jgi:hypothetical protein